MSTDATIELLDGTVIDNGSTWTFPYQVRDHAKTLADQDTNPQVYIFKWTHGNGVSEKKFYSKSCWDIDTFAVEIFEKHLKEHDWYFEYSDDNRVYKTGLKSYDAIMARYRGLKNRGMDNVAKMLFLHNSPKEFLPAELRENG